MKTICLFCGKSHEKRRPKLCKAKGEVISAYCKKLPLWKVFHAIDNGVIDLDGEAMRHIRKGRAV